MATHSLSAIKAAIKQLSEQKNKDKYINALWQCQALELHTKVLLQLSIQKNQTSLTDEILSYKPKINYSNSNLNDLISKLENFYPRPAHNILLDTLIKARDKRNEFIHKVFNVTSGDYRILNFSKNPELHPQSIKIMSDRQSAYFEASEQLMIYIQKFGNIKIKFTDIL